MITDSEKIAFIDIELMKLLEIWKPKVWKQLKEWYQMATNILFEYKQYLINQDSDDQERNEIARWH